MKSKLVLLFWAWLFVGIVCVSVASFAGGSVHHNTVVNNYYESEPGPPGPAGPQGLPGERGPAGIPGANASIDNRLETRLGADVRWYDWQHFGVSSGYRYDVNHGGHTVDFFVLGLKLGQSYEERRIERLYREMDLLIKVNQANAGTPPAGTTVPIRSAR